MLVDEVFSEFSVKGIETAENENFSCSVVEQNHTGPIAATAEDAAAMEKSSETENSILPMTNVIDSETNRLRSSQRELKLPLVSQLKLSDSLESPKWDHHPSGSCGVTASIPFQWEEQPGKPKNPSVDKSDFPLRLPPIRQSSLNCPVGGPRMAKKVPNNLSGKLKVLLKSRSSRHISATKVSTGTTNCNWDFSDYTNFDLESIWEEEGKDEEEMVELCRENYPTHAFPVFHSRRSYDSNVSKKYMLGISDFADKNSRRFSAKSSEFPPRRNHSYSPWTGSRSAELGLHISNPFSDSPFSTFNRPSMSRSPSTGDSASVLLANCLVSVIDMSNAVAVEDSSFSSLAKKVPNDLSGKLEVLLKSRPSKPISVSKVSTGMTNCKQDLSKDYANSDLESIWEEEDEEEMVELCKKTYPSQAFQSVHSRRSYDSNFSENYKWGISNFADINSRRFSAKSAEFVSRRYPYHSPSIGSRSAELGFHYYKSFPDSPSSTFQKPSISRSPSNGNSAPALLANCLMSATDMSNAVPVENSSFSNFKSPEDYISLKSSKMDCLELNLCTCKCKSTPKDQTGVFSWASLGQKSLSRQLRISHKYDQEFMRARSMQPASSLNLLKKVSSVVKRAVWDSPVLDVEFGNSDKVRKTQINASQNFMKDEEEYKDDNIIDRACSQQVSSTVSVDQGSGFSIPCQTKSSNSTYKHSAPLGLQQSSPSKDKVPCSIEATPAKNNCPNNIQRQIKDGREEAMALMEAMDTMKYKGCCEKHYKKRNGAKVQILSVLARKFVMSWFPSTTRLHNINGWCKKGGTQTITTVHHSKAAGYQRFDGVKVKKSRREHEMRL